MSPNLNTFRRLAFLTLTLAVFLGSSSQAMENKFKEELNARLARSPNRPSLAAVNPDAGSSQPHHHAGSGQVTRPGGSHQKSDERKSGSRVSEEVQSKANHGSGALVTGITTEEGFYNEGMQHYESGNYLEAKNSFTQAGKKHIGAMYLLGLMHETPDLRGVQHSDGMAAEWYEWVWGAYRTDEIWAEWHAYIMDAGYRLANIFLFNRWGGQYRGRESIAIYESLAKMGSPDGMYMYGWLFFKGGPWNYSKLINFDIDFPNAVRWLTEAAEKDHVLAMVALAELYGSYNNGDWRYRDPNVVRKWRQKAADMGHAESYNWLLADDNETRGRVDDTPSSLKMVVQKKPETPKRDDESSIKSNPILSKNIKIHNLKELTDWEEKVEKKHKSHRRFCFSCTKPETIGRNHYSGDCLTAQKLTMILTHHVTPGKNAWGQDPKQDAMLLGYLEVNMNGKWIEGKGYDIDAVWDEGTGDYKIVKVKY